MQTSQQQEVEVSTLYPERHLRRSLPVNLKPEHLSMFDQELEQVIPSSQLLIMQDVFASSEGVLFKSGRILPESFAAPFQLDAWKTKSRVKFLASNYLFKASRRLEREGVWILDNWSEGYYHWLADTLPRLYSIRERMSDLTLLVPERFKKLEFVNGSLRAFNLPSVELIGAHERISCPRLIVPMHTAPSGHHNDEVIQGIRKLMLDFYGERPEPNPNGRIYISRRLAPKRKVINEPEVAEIVAGFGFQVVDAEGLSFVQQVQLLATTRHLISNHGAGLTNMMFMPSGGSVLELRHRTDRSYNCYFNLASALNHKYFYLACQAANPEEDAHTADIQVDVNELKDTIRSMIDSE
jgi:capsular polysaccharide biosynthesis protein